MTTNGRTNVRTQTQSVEGVVEATNATGLKIGSAWINVSRYGKPVELPVRGSHVRCEVDDRGYIKSVEVLGATARNSADATADTARNSAVSRDRTISKLTVLKAAAHFGASRDITSAQVLQVADMWLKWLETEKGPRP